MSSDNPLVLEPVTCILNASDIRIYFGKGTGSVNLFDVIIAVRERYPDPHQKVILESDMSLNEGDLQEQGIYLKGINDNKISAFEGLGNRVYLPVRVESENDGDFGIPSKLSRYVNESGITSFNVLIYGDSFDLLSQAWAWFNYESGLRCRAFFPPAVTSKAQLVKNGVDISALANKMATYAGSGQLSTQKITEIAEEARGLVKARGTRDTLVQDLESTRSIYAKWLTMLLIQEFDLTPMYMFSYINEYVDLEIGYTFEKLSMAERIRFLSKLPEDVGYIGNDRHFRCILKILKKICPPPVLAFNLQTREVFSENLEDFEVGNNPSLKLYDYRTLFKESKSYFMGQAGGLMVASNTDVNVDGEIVKIFCEMAEKSDISGACFSVHNTLIAELSGQKYILYYDQPLGLVCEAASEYFGTHTMVIGEEEFKHLIDSKVVLAMNRSRVHRDVHKSNSEFNDIILSSKKTFTPSIPTFVLMCCVLSSRSGNGLSYYDRNLRCSPCLFPIVSHVDSELSNKESILDYIPMAKLLSDPVAVCDLSCFGGLKFHQSNGKLHVSVDSFRGCKLL